jgi:predicted membrane protein
MILILVGRTIDIRACTIIGAVGIVAFVLTIALVWCVVLGLVAKSHELLPVAGQRAVLIVLASLPFLTLRAAYFLLAEYPSKYEGVGRNAKFMGEAELMMELIAVVLLIVARTVVEPLWAALPETTLF